MHTSLHGVERHPFHPLHACKPRRAMLAGLAAVGAGAVLPGGDLLAQAPAAARPHRIDVHHHVTPPLFVTELHQQLLDLRPMLNWSPQKSLEDMDKAGVATAIASVTNPGIWFGNVEQSRRLARGFNEFAARLAADHPGRFGVFATLPLPDTEGSFGEIEYALDTLKSDGIGLMTNYGDKWLGDPAFDAVMAELNRRKAVVYTHPVAAACCGNLVPDIRDAVIEFATDTTRAIARVMFSGTAAKYPDIRWIFSHAGGTAPFLAERLLRVPVTNKELAARVPNGVMHELRKFHYDVAQAAHPYALASITKLVATSQMLFGTDFPFRTAADHVKGLVDYGFSETDLRAIDRDNALRLMPNLKTLKA
jgi:predicted TIM-barrel fold metal-dependent hydrolase